MKDPQLACLCATCKAIRFCDGRSAKPGIFQIRGSKTLLEILSLAEGLPTMPGGRHHLRRAGQKNAPEFFLRKRAGWRIFASDAVARVWRAQRNGHWFRQGGRKFKEWSGKLKTSSIRPIRATTQRISGRHRQSFPSGNRVCVVRCKGRAVSQ